MNIVICNDNSRMNLEWRLEGQKGSGFEECVTRVPGHNALFEFSLI